MTADQIEHLFNRCFASSHNTRLLGGAEEPLYQPSQPPDQPAQVHYRHDYSASALHEVAHWCIAGRQRRQQLDYGYWYAPDDRGGQEQQQFLTVEALPQALERLFAEAAGVTFVASLDNLALPSADEAALRARLIASINQASAGLQASGLPPRAQVFLGALEQARGADEPR